VSTRPLESAAESQENTIGLPVLTPTAAAATRFQNWWYYIAGDDARSKLYFVILETLLSVQLSEVAAKSQAPVLTVPVN
jgi:hypothetical protein